MSMPVFKESERPSWLMGIAAVVLSVALTFLSTNYFNRDKQVEDRNTFVENRLSEDQLAIASLKITTGNISDAERRVEASISAIEASQTAIAATLQSLKDANDAQNLASSNIKDQLNAVNTKLGALDDILRTPRVFPR